jgi:hypothetical protein
MKKLMREEVLMDGFFLIDQVYDKDYEHQVYRDC